MLRGDGLKESILWTLTNLSWGRSCNYAKLADGEEKWIFTVQFQYHKIKSAGDILVRHNCKYCNSLSSLLLPSLIHLFTNHAFNKYLLSTMVGTKNINK